MLRRNIIIIVMIFIFSVSLFIIRCEKTYAGSYDGQDLALAILENASTLVDSSYSDTDELGHRQSGVYSSRGIMQPTQGSTFILLTNGVADHNPITTDGVNPGDERGSWFEGGKFGYPRDRATLTLTLQVPPYMHYLYYDIQFFSAEYPEYIGTQYNDKITVTVNSPSQGTTSYFIDVNSGDFVLNSNDITGTGFDIFAQSGNPSSVDIVDTTPRTPGADAGATALVTREHPVSPYEQITVKFEIKDSGDNLFNSGAFIDNLVFSGYAKTDIIARKTYEDLNGGMIESGDTIRYTVTISNTGGADQNDNSGNEFEDFIPENTTYVADSATATHGTINYDSVNKKITWNGGIPAESSRMLTFDVTINSSVANGTIISNQGAVYWDSNEDGTNDATELTDNPHIDDGIDQDDDGETEDDDPTNFSVICFETPESVTEGFDDDTSGGSASQSYSGREWFYTFNEGHESVFEVAPSYHYQTQKSFKTKIRLDGKLHYWAYNLSNLESNIKSWEIWFKCGNTSEETDLTLEFINPLVQTIAQIKFVYTQQGEKPQDWFLKIYYLAPGSQWKQLSTGHLNGYLYNDWYKLTIEKDDNPMYINYYLERNNIGIVDSKTEMNLGGPFTDLAAVIWSSTKSPTDCQMFFWDEHKIVLEQE